MSNQLAISGEAHDTLVQSGPDFSSVIKTITDAPQDDPLRYKSAITVGKAIIHEHFLAGASAGKLLRWQTDLTDAILIHLWDENQNQFHNIDLIAVGGYGRGELHPASDVDICVLLPEKISDEQTQTLSAWITSLWDLGLDIGHSVRTLEQSITEARNDVTVITNLMESRLIRGEGELFAQLQAATAETKMWSSKAFFKAKMAEQNHRYSKFQTNAYRLEPNVKESKGGLRDIQTLAWVCQRHFGTRGISKLVPNDLLTEQEFELLKSGLELLWKIRYLLHHLSGRHEDRLLFDYQRDIAHAFGLNDSNDTQDNQSIERLMQLYYRSVMELQRINEFVMQGLGGTISGVTAKMKPTIINDRFQIRNGFLEVTHDNVFKDTPSALLEVFLIFGNTPRAENIRSNTVRLIRSHLHLINDDLRTSPKVRKLFISIFNNPNKLTRKVRMMNRYGILAAYIPAFDTIVGRMQYDLFHVYTVDEHTINVIRNLRRFALPEYADESPFCSFVAQQLAKPELLYLAALFHDIAKGRGGDHSILGAEDARRFCKAHELPDSETELVSWLVEHHLLMSITAQRKDISDPATQTEFTKKVGSLSKLNHLYLLTVADVRATNPDLWNSFKNSLLQSLYQSTALLLQRGLENPVDNLDMLTQRQTHTMRLLKKQKVKLNKKDIRALWERLGKDYFRQYPAREIARHTESILKNKDGAWPLVTLRKSESRGSTEILIYSPDEPGIFSSITTVLDRLALDVQSATINTTAEGFSLDTFYVLESNGSLITEQTRKQQIQQALVDQLKNNRYTHGSGSTRPSRHARHFSIPTTVEFDNNSDSNHSEVHIVAADRPGILSSIGHVFLNADVSVHAARIVTLGERIEDVFFVCNADQQALPEEERKQLAQMLIEEL